MSINKIINKIKNVFEASPNKLGPLEETYLNTAQSIQEVESRLREIEQGKAPWQINR